MLSYYLQILATEEVRITEEARMMGKGWPAFAAKSLSAAAPAAFYGSFSF
jgi:hypothetical protein